MSIGTQPESDIPIPLTDITEDPRNRYGSRPLPENYQQQTSPYYLPITRDNRFFPIFYDLHRANDCWKYMNVGLLNSQQLSCNSDDDCFKHINQYCTKGALNFVKSTCVKENNNNNNNNQNQELIPNSKKRMPQIHKDESFNYLSELNHSVKAENPFKFEPISALHLKKHNYCHYQTNGSNLS